MSVLYDWVEYHVTCLVRDISLSEHWASSYPDTVAIWLKDCWKRCKIRIKPTKHLVLLISLISLCRLLTTSGPKYLSDKQRLKRNSIDFPWCQSGPNYPKETEGKNENILECCDWHPLQNLLKFPFKGEQEWYASVLYYTLRKHAYSNVYWKFYNQKRKIFR